MELGEPALDVYLLPVTLPAAWPARGGDVTRCVGSGAAGVTVLVRAGRTGAEAATTGAGAAGCWLTEVRLAGTGATAVGVAGTTGVGGVVVVVVAGVVGVVVVVAVAEAAAASFALFSCLILSISSSS